jgi:hypothetical protein
VATHYEGGTEPTLASCLRGNKQPRVPLANQTRIHSSERIHVDVTKVALRKRVDQ